MSSGYTYTVPSACDGFVAQATLPLLGTATTTYMIDPFKYGGLMTMPIASMLMANVNWSSKQWDDIATFINAIKYTRKTVDMFLPYRVVGWGLNVVSADSALNQGGTLIGGQLESTLCSSTATTGGFAVGNVSTSAAQNMTLAEAIDSLTAVHTKRFTASEGITVRVVLTKDQYRHFKRPAVVPSYHAASSFYDCQDPAKFQAGSLDVWTTGRDFVPTVIVEGAAAGSKWSVTTQLIIEVDNTLRNLAFVPATFSPHSERYEWLNHLASSADVFPVVVSGHSFWNSMVRSANGMYRILPGLAGGVTHAAASSAGATASESRAAGELAKDIAQALITTPAYKTTATIRRPVSGGAISLAQPKRKVKKVKPRKATGSQ